MIRALEPSLSVKVKDELATALVSVLQSVDAARNFLVDVVMDEVKNEGECRFLFLIFGLSLGDRKGIRPVKSWVLVCW